MKVDILIPSYRNFRVESYNAINKMIAFTRQSKVKGQKVDCQSPVLRSSSVIAWARNYALKEVRKTANYILWCDDDMVPEPDALVRLMEDALPIVSALTTTREAFPPTLSVKAKVKDKDRFAPISDIKPDTIVTGDLAVGTGFLLVSKATMDLAIEDAMSAGDWLADNKAMFDRLGIPEDKREEERRQISRMRREMLEAGDAPPVFNYDMAEEGFRMGEDVSFCRRLLRLGVKIAVDTRVQVGHLGDFPYGAWNIGTEDAKDVRF